MPLSPLGERVARNRRFRRAARVGLEGVPAGPLIVNNSVGQDTEKDACIANLATWAKLIEHRVLKGVVRRESPPSRSKFELPVDQSSANAPEPTGRRWVTWTEVVMFIICARVCAVQALATTSRCVLSLLFLLLLPSVTRPQEFAPSESRRRDEYTISVRSECVILHATAQNHKGTLVSGLHKEDFQVYENGVLQQIEHFSHEDIPVTVGLVLDNSASMRPKRSEVIAAAMAFARSSNPQDQMFVVNFNEHVSFGLPANTPFTDQTAQLADALSKFNANGETALYDALAAALDHLKQGNRDKKVLIVVSDGGDNASKYNLGQILARAGQSDAIIYTIGIYTEDDPDRNPARAPAAFQGHGRRGFLSGVPAGRCPSLRTNRT